MRFLATLCLALALLVPYYFLSNGTFYLPDQTLSGLAFEQNAGMFNYFSHLFTHVGLGHLLGNLLPLIAFSLVLEQVLGWSVIAVFVVSGLLSSLAFSFLNPSVILVGASTGVAGLMSASTLVKPKISLALLLIAFVVLFFVAPAVAFVNSLQLQGMESQKQALQQQVAALVAQNKTEEAVKANATLSRVETTLAQTEQGIQREKETPTDALVHFLGALFGGAFIILFHKSQLRDRT